MPLERTRLAAVVLLAATVSLAAAEPPAGIPEPDPFSPLDFDPIAVLSEARAALDAGQPTAAAERLLQLEDSVLGDHVARLRAQALMARGASLEAEAALARGLERDPPTELRAAIEAMLGRLALERDDLPTAYERFRNAWAAARDADHAAALAVEIGRAFEARHLPGDALSVYRKAWSEWPLTAGGTTAFERARFLESATGAPPLSPGTLRLHADRLRGAYRCAGALPLYEESLASGKLGPSERSAAERGRAACLMARRRYPEAVVAYEKLVEASPEDATLSIQLARAHGRGGARGRAAGDLLKIAKRTRGHERARTRYLAALYLEDDEPERALELLRSVERQKGARGYVRLARWRLAWADVRAGHYPEAEKRLSPMARGQLSDIEVQRARYWLARARMAQGRELEGRATLEEIVQTVPLSYYGLVSAPHLDGPPVLERELIEAREAGPPEASLERAAWLSRGGFPDAARLELYSRLRSGTLDRETRVGLADLLHEVGDHFRAVRTIVNGFGDTLEQGIDDRWREVWEHAWPRPFLQKVHAAAAEFGGDPALVYAIMREESTFRPEVESPVGARGLMQIIPPTGDEIARALGSQGFDPDQLFVAGTNVRFGTWYLEHLLDRFSETRPYAIAAYNAGPDAVQRWLTRDGGHGGRDLDVFVDSVPYGETRRYLRKVLRSFHVYRLLYGGAEATRLANPSQPEASAIR